jgi:hypothetical protein
MARADWVRLSQACRALELFLGVSAAVTLVIASRQGEDSASNMDPTKDCSRILCFCTKIFSARTDKRVRSFASLESNPLPFPCSNFDATFANPARGSFQLSAAVYKRIEAKAGKKRRRGVCMREQKRPARSTRRTLKLRCSCCKEHQTSEHRKAAILQRRLGQLGS